METFRTTDNINLRSTPGGTVVGKISKNTVVQVSEKSGQWAHIARGWVSANYLEKLLNTGWAPPVPTPRFKLTQRYLNEDWALYPKFGHHTGVDYGGAGQKGIPLFACADGEIVYTDVANSAWGAALGNHAALYVPSVDKSFLYCHMAAAPHALGPVKSGDQIGIMGNTGKSAGGAIHLHLEGFNGRFVIVWRSFTSLEDIKRKTFDADQFIRSQIH